MRRASFHLPFLHEAILAALLIGMLVWAKQTEPFPRRPFVSIRSQRQLAADLWQPALLAVPMTLIIISGGIDLSVGSTMALSSVVLGFSFRHGFSNPFAAGFAILVGAAAGFVNGIFIAKLRVHALLVTLATFSAYRGIAEGISGGEPISGFPPSFLDSFATNFLGMSLAGWIVLVIYLFAGAILMWHLLGMQIYAMGNNEVAARYSRSRVDAIKMMLYTISGASAGLSAVFYAALRNTAKADVGNGIELNVITAVVLGGTSIFGGSGNILGTALGVILLHETSKLVPWRWENDELNLIVVGGLLIAAVLVNRLLKTCRRS